LTVGGGVSSGATPCWHPARPSYLAEAVIAKLVCGMLKVGAPSDSEQRFRFDPEHTSLVAI